MPAQTLSTAPHASTLPLEGQRVLLVTDRPFLHPVDGSTHTYLMWLHVLLDLGCRVSVLSFDRRSARWSAEDRAGLQALAESVLILDAHSGRAGAVLDEGASMAWRLAAGRRFLPSRIEAVLRRKNRGRVASLLRDGRFDAIVVNKLHTTALVGWDVLRSTPARKLIDMHDNYPIRETLNRRIMLDLARTDRAALRMAARPKDLLEVAGWSGQGRKLNEEVARLRGFDHVVFNAREEAAIYVRTGLPQANVAVLPLPRPEERRAGGSEGGGARPYQVGLIASAALPNIEGLRFLLGQIMPVLRTRGVRLLVAGTIGRYARPLLGPDDDALGWIDDVAEFYDQVEVILVPLLSGTGVSVKAMEAASFGAAIVTTTVGMRGLDLEPGRDLLVADDAPAFANSVLRVLDDPVLRADLRRNAQAGLIRRHARDVFMGGVARLLAPAGTGAA